MSSVQRRPAWPAWPSMGGSLHNSHVAILQQELYAEEKSLTI